MRGGVSKEIGAPASGILATRATSDAPARRSRTRYLKRDYSRRANVLSQNWRGPQQGVIHNLCPSATKRKVERGQSLPRVFANLRTKMSALYRLGGGRYFAEAAAAARFASFSFTAVAPLPTRLRR